MENRILRSISFSLKNLLPIVVISIASISLFLTGIFNFLKIFLFALIFLSILILAFIYLFAIYRFEPKIEIPDKYSEIRRTKKFPPAFPNSWWKLCDASDLKKGQVREIDALGQKFAVFRSENGIVSVFDAYCPHLAANLAYGKVVGSTLECPFHGWKFDGADGKCVDIPYAEKIPKQAVVRCWKSLEIWDMILVWFHCDNELPHWTPDEIPELVRPKSPYTFRYKASDIVRMHVQDFVENGPDAAHFEPVHGKLTIPILNRFVRIKHETSWKNGTSNNKETQHIGEFTNLVSVVWISNGKSIPSAGAKALTTFYGPGLVIFRFLTFFGEVILLKTFTPLESLVQRMDDRIYAESKLPTFIVKYIVNEANTQFYQDIKIWSRKSYTSTPLIVKEDGNILGVRRWFQQFYSKNSRRGADLQW